MLPLQAPPEFVPFRRFRDAEDANALRLVEECVTPADPNRQIRLNHYASLLAPMEDAARRRALRLCRVTAVTGPESLARLVDVRPSSKSVREMP